MIRLSRSERLHPELSYASAAQPRLKRWVIRAVEAGAGRERYARLYGIWRREVVPAGDRVFGRLLDLVGIRLETRGAWPAAVPDEPLVLVANHPFGIGDGVAMLALAESIGRPFRVLIHSELLKIPEMRAYALAVDFSETREALAANIAVRHEAVRLLKAGVTVVIFPAGGVATAPKGFSGKAEDLPWKIFVAKLIQEANAAVLPLFFHGQNSRLFHVVSRPMGLAESGNPLARAIGRAALTLRLSLLVREFARLSGRTIAVTVGAPIPWTALAPMRDRKKLLEHLRGLVAGLEGDRPARARGSRGLKPLRGAGGSPSDRLKNGAGVDGGVLPT